MKTKVFALLAVLVMFAGVFTSCDSSDYEPMAQTSEDSQVMSSNLDNAPLRISDMYYHMSETYKPYYSHVQNLQGIAAGFASTWNCISSKEGLGNTLTVSSIISALGATPPNYTIGVPALVSYYSNSLGARLEAKTGEYDDPIQDKFVRWLRYYWETSGNVRPICVLVKFGNTENKKMLVPVYSLSGGRIYFSNPHLGQNGDSFSASLRSMTLGSFVQHAKQASSDGNTVNIVYFQ